MKRVAIFGNTGGGKSTLAKTLAKLTSLPLYPLDLVQFATGGDKIPHDEYLKVHADLIRRDAWIIDGFGCVESAWNRFAAADTLIYIDLPLSLHYWWVAKRLIKSAVVAPEGWPEDSPIWNSTFYCWRAVRSCERDLAPKYRDLVADSSSSKRVHHLRSARQIGRFVEAVRDEYRR
jgi:adenylate kinase family enzyme